MFRLCSLVVLVVGCGVDAEGTSETGSHAEATAVDVDAYGPDSSLLESGQLAAFLLSLSRCDLSEASPQPTVGSTSHLADTDNTSCGFVPVDSIEVRRGTRVTRMSDGDGAALPPVLDGPGRGLLLTEPERGRVIWVTADGKERVIAKGGWSPNGLSWSPNGDLVVVTRFGRRYRFSRW